MYLKFSSVLGLFFLWDKLCSGASKRFQSLGRLCSWGAPPVMHNHWRSDIDVCASTSTPHCNHTEKDCRKLPPVVPSSTSLLPWPASLSMKTNVCTPDTHSQHWATAVVYTAEAGRAEGTVLFWHLNNNYFFWTLAFDIEALCSKMKSWWHYGTWNCTALLLG